MKNLIKIISIFILTFFISGTLLVNAVGVEGLESVKGIHNITNKSIDIQPGTDISDSINDVGFGILTTIKYVVSGLLVIFLVYVGIQMIMSMGSDEEKLSTAKRQLWYTIMGLVFINIPGTLFNSFISEENVLNSSIGGTWTSTISSFSNNLFINNSEFLSAIGGIVIFLEVVIFSIAIFVIVLSGLKIIMSAGKEEDLSEAKSKILWSLVGLIFIGFIEAWKKFIYTGDIISEGAGIFITLVELILFFAGPVAIFFLTLAGYYYITSNGDEERTKKAKHIVINTLIATIILIAAYSFLIDLKAF